MSDELLYGLSEWLIAAMMIVLLLGAADVGYRLGLKGPTSFNDVAKSMLGTISAGILGLLALLLGFTFSMSLARFDHRKALVTQEANAIGTAYLRSQLLPESDRHEIARLLRNYVDARLDLFQAHIDPSQRETIIVRNAALQQQLWSHVATTLAKDERAVTTGLFVQSLNEVIDLDSQRVAAMENHVPQPVLLLICLGATIALLIVGYGCGLGKYRHFPATTMLAVLLMIVITVIMDLDRPHRGLIQVSQKSMIRLRESMSKDAP